MFSGNRVARRTEDTLLVPEREAWRPTMADGGNNMADFPTRKSSGEEAPEPERSAVERLIDEIVDDTFPASDPPAWGVAASRLERSREADRVALRNAADRGSR